MKKIMLFILALTVSAQMGFCELSKKEVNIYNLKEKNMYVLNLDSSVKSISVSNKEIVNVSTITSLENEKKQLFVEANDDGVCDVVVTTNAGIYQIRFISGPIFQDDKKELTEIDIPTKATFEDESK